MAAGTAPKTRQQAQGAKNKHSEIDPEIAALSDDWEALTDAGRAYVEGKTDAQWKLGDLLQRALACYASPHAQRGEQKQIIGRFGSAIGENPSSLKVYYSVSKFYPPAARGEYANLSYAHYKIAMRLKDLDAALALLERASADGWSTRETTDAVKAALNEVPLRRAVFDGFGTCVFDARAQTWSLRLDGETGALAAGMIYRAELWEIDA